MKIKKFDARGFMVCVVAPAAAIICGMLLGAWYASREYKKEIAALTREWQSERRVIVGEVMMWRDYFIKKEGLK